MGNPNTTHAAFDGDRLVHRGPLADVLAAVKLSPSTETAPLLIFETDSGRQVDFDLRGTLDEVLERVRAQVPRRGPGRPKLGVESREVTLLPRHWAWLESQPSGASAALRRLVDEARKHDRALDDPRTQRDACYRTMTVLAGDRRGFEEAARALYAGDTPKFRELTDKWPGDVRAHIDWMLAGEGAASERAPV